MTIDLVIAALTLLFGVLGALTGAARQVGQLAALATAAFCIRPLGNALAPHLTSALGGPAVLGVVAGWVLAFFVVFSVVRYALTALLKRVLAGEREERAGLDRLLGFLLGSAKVLAIAWVVLSALAFAEERVSVAGRRLGVSPRDSLAFGLARKHNLFELAQFGATKDLLAVASAARDSEARARLKSDPAWRALQEDPRFRRALADPQVARALESGNWRTALQSDTVLQLVRDPVAARRLRAAASVAR